MVTPKIDSGSDLEKHQPGSAHRFSRVSPKSYLLPKLALARSEILQSGYRAALVESTLKPFRYNDKRALNWIA
jgi:hypothetical protein